MGLWRRKRDLESIVRRCSSPSAGAQVALALRAVLFVLIGWYLLADRATGRTDHNDWPGDALHELQPALRIQAL